MAREVDLDEFRSEWRKELVSQNVSLPYHPTKGVPEKKPPSSDPFASNKRQTSWGHVDNSKEVESRAASLLSQVTDNVSDVMYHPFLIVGRLLREGSCPSLNTSAADRDTQTPAARATSSKRSYFHSATESSGEPRARRDDTKKKKMKTASGGDEGKRRESLIDYLVADWDEINEIPFFEISLARELALKIFQHLDFKDLCRCAQVSSSWQSLSEDNWLWYNVYCQRGTDMAPPIIEEDNWKSVVKDEHERQKTLLSNWKVRLGRVRSLQYVQGGVLSAASYHGDTLVAGYSNGQVKLHNFSNGDVCVFQPSDMSLQLDHSTDEGTLVNGITAVDNTHSLTVAVFKHGFVDIWWNDGDLKPCHTVHSGTNISSVSLTETHSDMVVAVATGPHVIFEAAKKRHREQHAEGEEVSVFRRLVKADFNQKVSTVKFLPSTETLCTLDCKLAVATKHAVKIYTASCNNNYSSSNNDATTTVAADAKNCTEVHNMYGTPITCMEVCGGRQPTLAVGLGSSTGLFDGYQVKLYDINSGKPSVTFYGHTWYVSCMHLNSSSNNGQASTTTMLSTGCADRKVRLYDSRFSYPVMTLAGHTQKISTVQADDWKIVSGGEDGIVTVWDIRMATRLWDWHNRHPVRLCRYTDDRYLVVANVPEDEAFVEPPPPDDGDGFADRNHRGTLHVYDFLGDDQQHHLAEALPDICRSSYDQLHGYDYGINLVTPYDNI